MQSKKKKAWRPPKNPCQTLVQVCILSGQERWACPHMGIVFCQPQISSPATLNWMSKEYSKFIKKLGSSQHTFEKSEVVNLLPIMSSSNADPCLHWQPTKRAPDKVPLWITFPGLTAACKQSGPYLANDITWDPPPLRSLGQGKGGILADPPPFQARPSCTWDWYEFWGIYFFCVGNPFKCYNRPKKDLALILEETRAFCFYCMGFPPKFYTRPRSRIRVWYEFWEEPRLFFFFFPGTWLPSN